MAEQPNDASRKSKAEGDRWEGDSEQAPDQSTDEQSGGITNRPLDEETSNQQVPSPGDSKRRPDTGRDAPDIEMDMDLDSRRSER